VAGNVLCSDRLFIEVASVPRLGGIGDQSYCAVFAAGIWPIGYGQYLNIIRGIYSASDAGQYRHCDETRVGYVTIRLAKKKRPKNPASDAGGRYRRRHRLTEIL